MDATPSDPIVRRRLPPFWLVCLASAAFLLGLWAAFTPALGNTLTPIVGGILIAAGIVLVSPLATATPVDRRQRRARRALQTMGVGNILAGGSLLTPGGWPQLILMGLAAVVMARAAWIMRASKQAMPALPETSRD